jgi:hypothetical protein
MGSRAVVADPVGPNELPSPADLTNAYRVLKAPPQAGMPS